MEKSHVTMEQKLCMVCGNAYDTGNILMDMKLGKTFNQYTVTGIDGLCHEHQKMLDDANKKLGHCSWLIEVTNIDLEKPEDADRTGKVMLSVTPDDIPDITFVSED